MAIIAITNQKGGVGKTTTAINLGAGLALAGKKTLIVDLDAQCNATQALYRRLEEGERGVCEVLLEETPIEEIVVPTSVEGLFIAPAGESLANADLNLASLMGRERYLKNTLSGGGAAAFDHVVIDTGPYLGLLIVNAYVASDFLIVPVSCDYLPLLGIKLLLETIEKVRRKLHPDLSILGFLLTMYDRRERITFSVEEVLMRQFGERIFNTRIRINTKHRSAPSVRETIFQYEKSNVGKGTQDFNALTEEVLARLSGGTGHG